jgi:hypothetical protein
MKYPAGQAGEYLSRNRGSEAQGSQAMIVPLVCCTHGVLWRYRRPRNSSTLLYSKPQGTRLRLDHPGVFWGFLGFWFDSGVVVKFFLSFRAICFLGDNIQIHYFRDGCTSFRLQS